MKRFKTADEFIKAQEDFGNELSRLRKIINSTELEETVKWGFPVYTLKGKNVAGLGSFKSYFGVWFFQGVFLKDKQKKLVNAQEGKTQAMRQWRMNNDDDIDESLLVKYLEEAIQNEREGKKVKPKSKPLVIPAELKEAFTNDPKLEKAFDAFSLGNRRDFAEHVGGAKREDTRVRRLNKIIPMIHEGVGLNDKYK